MSVKKYARQNGINLRIFFDKDNVKRFKTDVGGVVDKACLLYTSELYSIYYHRIFPDALAMADVFTYYQSWLLRGDSPYCYQNGDIAMLPDYSAEIMDSWNKVAFNHHLDIDNARKNKEA